jgi:hypothetical protein
MLTANQAPDSPQRQEPGENRPVAAALANFVVAAGPVATIIALVTAGRRAFAICVIASGALIAAAAAVYQFGQTEWYKQRSKRLRRYAFYALGGIMLAVGIPTLAFAPSGSPDLAHPASSSRSSGAPAPATPATCAGKPQISGGDTPAQNFVLTVYLPCARSSGDQLWLMTQVSVAAKSTSQAHSDYYFYASVKNDAGKQELNITADTCAPRQWYLIAVTSDQLVQLRKLPHTARMAYYGNTFDAIIREYIVSNLQSARTCSQ